MSYAGVTVPIPTSPVGKAIKSNYGHSSKDTRVQTRMMRRSCSDSHLCYAANRSTEPKLTASRSFGIFPFQLSGSIIPKGVRSLLFESETSDATETKDNWMERLMEVRSLWRDKQTEGDSDLEHGSDCNNGDDEEEAGRCEACSETSSYDRESFSKLLNKVPSSDTRLYSKLAFLCHMAYKIPQIKSYDLKGHYGLEFVTSSLQRKAEAEALQAILDQDSVRVPILESNLDIAESNRKHSLSPYSPYEIAASAASYVQSRAKDLLSTLGSESVGNKGSEAAACMAASTLTAVVKAGEEEKLKAARDLQSLHSSPCEWFISDDTSTFTRCFVIKGSDSLAAWQANLFFEPTQFEGMDALVHRGIYEAAKGTYEQLLAEIKEHLNRYGDRAKFQFTGHSLGGSIALLVHLMLVARKVADPSSLNPTVTFGSPFVFCGGQEMLRELGLDESHVHCVMMHRDIVPRAFSCTYPHHVASMLTRIESFRSHPCLAKKKLLYPPLGKMLILQPEEKSSPPHPLLPPGAALYALDESPESALCEFLNNPHPLDTLSDPAAYGSEGAILRDHRSNNYMKAIRGILKPSRKRHVVRKQRNLTWPLLASPSTQSWSRHTTLVDSSNLLTNKLLVSVAC